MMLILYVVFFFGAGLVTLFLVAQQLYGPVQTKPYSIRPNKPNPKKTKIEQIKGRDLFGVKKYLHL